MLEKVDNKQVSVEVNITPEQALSKLKELLERGNDTEYDHQEADGILCELLMSLGHVEVVEVYRQIPKWFA